MPKRTAKPAKKPAMPVVAMPQAATKAEAEKSLARVPVEFPLWASDGLVLMSSRDLADALVNMSEETFAYHHNEVKKDFANWVRDIIKDEVLAKDLDKPLTREAAGKIVSERVAFLSTVLA